MARRRRPTSQQEAEFYETHRSQFVWLTEQARFISNRIGTHIANPPQGYATWLWIRACITSGSLIRLFEPQTAGKAIYLDHASIAALSRALIENLAVMIYLGDQNLSQEEWDARRTLIHLNDRLNRASFLRNIGQLSKEPDDTLVEKLKDDLLANDVFMALPKDRRGKLLNGEDMFLYGRHKAMLVFGWGDNITRGVYKYLSSHAHSTALAFSRTEANRIYQPDSNASKVTAGFALDHARQALGTGCLHMISLFPYVEAAFDPLVFLSLKNDYCLPVLFTPSTGTV